MVRFLFFAGSSPSTSLVINIVHAIQQPPVSKEAAASQSIPTSNQSESERIASFVMKSALPIVVVQGLGFVGTAMVAALSVAQRSDGTPCFKVIGVDVDTEQGQRKVSKINAGKPAIVSSDSNIDDAIQLGWDEERLMATTLVDVYQYADVLVIDINLDVQKWYDESALQYDVDLSVYRKAIKDVAETIKEDALVIVESTVPPGMTEEVIYPIFRAAFDQRGLDIQKLSLVHSYERVMPGANYLKSITDYYRVFAGMTSGASLKARRFSEQFINVDEYPLTELASPRASEISKVLENSYRAMNIAFIQEWTEFAEEAGVNLFEVLRAIKLRATHNNIMAPGFGVGGYCLTKDSLLADWSKINLFGSASHLEKSIAAVHTNDQMPLHSFRLLKKAIGSLENTTIALLGVSYLNDVADTRSSPADIFYEACMAEGANMVLHDSFVSYWPERKLNVLNDLKAVGAQNPEVVIFAVRHSEYLQIDAETLYHLFSSAKVIVDANNIISDEKAAYLHGKNVRLIGVGKGHWKTLL